MAYASAGRRLPVRMVLSSRRLIPIPKISSPPVAVMAFKTAGLCRNISFEARSVMDPWTTNTDRAEKATPTPKVDARAMEATPSKSDLT